MGPRVNRTPPNLKSCNNYPQAVIDKLSLEVRLNRIAGPFRYPPLEPLVVNPIGIIPKKERGKFRLIHNLSFPEKGGSINAGIPPAWKSVSYSTVDDAINVIRRLGRGCLLSKTDIQDSYRLVPIHPSDYNLMGIYFNGFYYIDRCLQMGCASACKIFDSFSKALLWIATTKLGILNCVYLLDDFLFIQGPEEPSDLYLSRFLAMCADVGVPIAHHKTVHSTTKLTFLGIELDTVAMAARLDSEKLCKCVGLLSQFITRKKVTLVELQSVIGLLNFCCCVVRPGRAFLRRLIDLTIGVSRSWYKITLTMEVKQDLHMWLLFLRDFNGTCFFLPHRWLNSESLQFYTDACPTGYGGIFQTQWFYGEFPQAWQSYNITILEAFPVALSLALWGSHIANSNVTFFTDNEGLVSILNKQTSREKFLMKFVRFIVLHALSQNILFRAKHVASKLNAPADCLSRLQIHRFRELCPAADEHPRVIPSHLTPTAWD